MRIISDYKDFYDGVQSIILDKSCLYIRKSNRVNLFKAKEKYRDYIEDISEFKYIIGFCGKLYPVKKLYSFRSIPINKIVYSLKEDNEIISEFVPEKLINKYLTHRYKFNKYRVDFFCEDFSKYKEIFREYKVPIFIINLAEGTLDLNCELKYFEFYRIFDSYLAFQEIYMYLSGILGGEFKTIPHISDEIMAEAKGFDKFSFRKDKI